MPMHRFLTAIVAIAFLTTSATAQLVRKLEFNVDGQLPSAEPGINFHNTSGSPEGALYSVSGGLLQQRTFDTNGNSSYNYFPNNVSPLSAALDLTLEARLRILEIEGLGGAYFQAFNGVKRFTASFDSTGVALNTAAGQVTVPVDVFQYHTYRIESPANSGALNFYIDGSLSFSGIAESAGLNGFDWGDGYTPAGIGADADWDYFRVSNVPEPNSFLLFGSALGCVGIRIRRRHFA